MAIKKDGTVLMASYGMGKFLAEFLTGAFASLVFKFYETEIGLPAGLVAAAVVLYSIWNALNDPLIGFLTAKPTRLASRLGRRFPWILIGSLTCVFAFILIFAPLRSSNVVTFLWLFLSICLYDALYSTWEVNYQSIFPDRFREGSIRTKAAGIATLVGALAGIPLWSLLRKFIKSNQSLLALSAAALAVFCVPLLFVVGYWGFVVAMFAWGIAFGGFWMLMTPAMADVIDEVVVDTGKRDDGVYIGFRAFAGRLAYAVQALSFWAVHALTGFADNPRSDAAKTGVRIHTALIPAILLALGVMFFLFLNKMDAEKAARNRQALKERGL